MRRTALAARPDRTGSRPVAVSPRAIRLLTIALIVVALGLMAVSLCLAPRLGALGLAVVGIGLPMMLVLWTRPELGLLAIVFLAANFIPLDVVDVRLPIGGGLELRDLLLLGLLGMLIIRGLARKSLRIPWWPVGAPLLVFLALALLSAAYALLWQGVETNWVLAELRDLFAYALFFMTAWVLVQRRHLVTLLAGLFVIADLTAVIIFVQQLLGASRPLLPAMTGSYWGIWTQGGGAASIGLVRVVPPNHVLVYFAMLIAGSLAMFQSNRTLRAVLAVQFGMLGLALLLTYTRSQWVATAVALALMAAVVLPAHKTRIARYAPIGASILLAACALAGIALQWGLAKTPSVSLLVDRAATLLTPDEILSSSSARWRAFETEQALDSVSDHPLIGVGLGNSYRDITTLQGEARGWYTRNSLAAGELSRFTRYVHSSYLWIMVKMGTPALVIFLWFCAALLVAGWQLLHRLPDGQMKGIVLAVVAGFAGLLVWSIFHQHLVMNRSSTAVALVAGLLAGIYFMHTAEHAPAPRRATCPGGQEAPGDADGRESR